MGNFYIWSGEVQGLVEYFDPNFLTEYQYWNIEPLADTDSWKQIKNIHCIEQGLWWKHQEEHYGPDIIICGPCSSVLDIAWKLSATNCLNLWDSVISVEQWAGRGQLRRRWSSPIGNIYAALKSSSLVNLSSISLQVIMGFCLVKSFEALGVSLELKWPNDLMLHRRKVGGILIEEKKEDIFAGIGINLNCIPVISANENPDVVAIQKLQHPPQSVNPASFWQRLVHRVVLWYEVIVANENMQNIAAQIEQVMAFLGDEIQIESSGEQFTAKILGVDNQLGLRVEKDGREKILYNASLL